jgi:hypothetical protein
MHPLQKEFIEKYLYVFTHEELYAHETMVERMTELTSSSSNVYGVIDDNNNPYRNMVMDMIWMNWGYACECLIVDEEPYADVTSFF